MRCLVLIPVALCFAVAALVAGCHGNTDDANSNDANSAVSSAANNSSDAAAADASDDSILPAAERAFLWECEHYGNRLGQIGFSALSKALLAGEPAAVARFCSPDFQASVPSEAAEIRWEKDSITASRVIGVETPQLLNQDEFALWLLELPQNISRGAPSIKFELLHLAPLDRNNLEGGWEGRCRLRIQGTGNAGQGSAGQMLEVLVQLSFRTLSPTEEILQAGGWLEKCVVSQIDVRRSPQPLMREVSEQRGFKTDDLFDNWQAKKEERLITSGGVYLCDFDRDGYTDVLVMAERTAHNPRFYRCLPAGRFEDVTYRIGLPDLPGVTQAVFVDINNDGWEDLFFIGWGVFLNRQGKIFQLRKDSNLPQLVLEAGMDGVSGASVADFDRDGLIDIYITRADTREHKKGSWVDGKSGNIRGNQLLRNLGNGRFEDVTQTAGADGGRRSAFTAGWLDANNDAWPDLYVIHEFGAGALLVNQKNGSFTERLLGDASADFGSMGLALGDIDNDGQIDMYVSNMYSKAGNRVMDNLPSDSYETETLRKLRRMVAGSELHLNEGGFHFQSIADAAGIANVGWSWGPVLVDLNNDGLLDIHSTCGFMSHDRRKPDG